jgi:hypothetical protein
MEGLRIANSFFSILIAPEKAWDAWGWDANMSYNPEKVEGVALPQSELIGEMC